MHRMRKGEGIEEVQEAPHKMRRGKYHQKSSLSHFKIGFVPQRKHSTNPTNATLEPSLQARFCDSACEKKGHERKGEEPPPAEEEGNAVETAAVMAITDADIAKMNKKEDRKFKRMMAGGNGINYYNHSASGGNCRATSFVKYC